MTSLSLLALLAAAMALVLIPAVQARPAARRSARETSDAPATRPAKGQRRAARRDLRQAGTGVRGQARPATPAPAARAPVSHPRVPATRVAHHGRGPEREYAIVTSTCNVINWTFRKFPDLPSNTVIEKLSIAHYAPVFQTLTFDGEGHAVLTQISPPPGRDRIDTRAHWKTNGTRGGFDILSKKECPPAPAFTIEKLQRIMGAGKSFTTAPLVAELGQTVEYEIVIHNIGNVPLVLSNFSDPRCDPGTIAGGQGETPLAPGPMPSMGAATTYTCTHQMTSSSAYENDASVTATPPPSDGSPLNHTSNTVLVTVPAPALPNLYVGYADGAQNNHPGGLPSPWKGSEGVTFDSCGYGGSDRCPKSAGADVYDGGTIMVEATPASGTVSVSAAKVVIGPCVYEPWPGLDAAIAPGHKLILAQTGYHQCTPGNSEQDNFDTSESFLKSSAYQQHLKGKPCVNDGWTPQITLTLNGQAHTLQDSAQVLNDGGIDPDICTDSTEAHPWVTLSSAPHGTRASSAAPSCPASQRRRSSHARGRSGRAPCAGARPVSSVLSQPLSVPVILL